MHPNRLHPLTLQFPEQELHFDNMHVIYPNGTFDDFSKYLKPSSILINGIRYLYKNSIYDVFNGSLGVGNYEIIRKNFGDPSCVKITLNTYQRDI